jgi:citrate lyase beta subunit
MHKRSYHFVPAHRPEFFTKIAKLSADAYIFDLEDSVPADQKNSALQNLFEWFAAVPDLKNHYVRINEVDSSFSSAEKKLFEEFPSLGLVLPKLQNLATLEIADLLFNLKARSVIGLIEDAKGLLALPEILSCNLLDAIGLGLEDFLAESIFSASQLKLFVHSIRSKMALIAMSNNIEAVDTISLDFSLSGISLSTETEAALACGMTGKFTIHPNQINHVNRIFSPDQNLIDLASKHQTILNSNDKLSGYTVINGDVLSPPKIKKLKSIVQHCAHYE